MAKKFRVIGGSFAFASAGVLDEATMEHDGSHFLINNDTGKTKFGDKSNYQFTLDHANTRIGIGTESPGYGIHVKITGNDAILFLERVGGVQGYLSATATQFIMSTNASELRIVNSVSNGKIILKTESGANVYQVIILDPSTTSIDLHNEWTLKHGSNLDMYPLSVGEIGYHIDNKINNFYIDNKANGFNTIFRNNNTGGTTKTLLTLDPDKETTKVMGFEGTSITIAADTDNQDVKGVSIIYIDTSGGNVVIGGLAGGVTDQVIFMRKTNAANTATIEHNEAAGTQKIFTHDTNDISLTNYGGPTIVFDGTQWQADGY